MKVSICIATFRRAERLSALLEDLTHLSRTPDEVVIVDNDSAGSARAVAEHWRSRTQAFPIHYAIQPERNIALTRNVSVQMANGDWLAFIDDDERAPKEWLQQLLDAAEKYGADAVLGPVVPEVPAEAPNWIRRGNFYDFPRLPTGTEVPLNRMRFGNVIVRGEPLRAQPGPFNVAYGLTTGEDADLLIRMVHSGSRVIWSDEAIVIEPVEKGRLSLRWLLQRALSGGQEFARKTLAGKYGPITLSGRITLFMRALVQLAIASVAVPLTYPLGRHIAAQWLVKASANLGKLSIFWGSRYEEYAKA